MTRKFILCAIIFQIALASVFVYFGMTATPRLKWDSSMAVPDMSKATDGIEIYSMLPDKAKWNTNDEWYAGTLSRISSAFANTIGFDAKLNYKVLADTPTFMKYRLYDKGSDAQWIVWVDLLPLKNGNAEPRIAIERVKSGTWLSKGGTNGR
jgi:hypothetical protein